MTSEQERMPATPPSREVATLGGGCFWCLEAVFEQLQGVQKVESGYSGGDVPSPTYRQVCSGTTGHAEVVQITFDPAVISFREILDVFFVTHDPTTLNRPAAPGHQGHRRGPDAEAASATATPRRAAARTLFRDGGEITDTIRHQIRAGLRYLASAPESFFYREKQHGQSRE
jgi:methionine-S-sulfoxide reductase